MVNETLAKKMAGDGEGCTALFEVKIIGAESKQQAVTLAKSVITSNLTKAAILDMMRTGEEFSAQWAIPALCLIRKKWICSLKAQQES